MRRTRAFRLIALCLALFHTAAMPVASWADALLQGRTAAAEARWGGSHAEERGARHAAVVHRDDCVLCSHLALGRAPAPGHAPPAIVQAVAAPARALSAGSATPGIRALTLARAPPASA